MGIVIHHNFGKLEEDEESSPSTILSLLAEQADSIERLFVVTYTEDGIGVYGNFTDMQQLISLMEAIKFDIFVKYGAMVDLRES